MSELHNALATLGLSDKESEVYITLLKLGNVTVTKISRSAQLHRVTTYSILKRLIEKWVVSELIKWKTKRYTAVDPKVLSYKMDIAYKAFQDQLPALLAITNSAHKPSVAYYEWMNWVQSIYEDMLSSKTDIYSFIWDEYIDESFKKYLSEWYVPTRIKKKIFLHVIAPHTSDMLTHQAQDSSSHREMVLIDKPYFGVNNKIILYDNCKIAIILDDEKNMSWLRITSEWLHKNLLWLFNLIYDAYKTKS